jgi:hypothetical protein
MNKEDFEKVWAKSAKAPRVTEVKVQPREPDLSLEKIVERIEELAESSVKGGHLKRAHYEEMVIHTTNLKQVIRKADPDNALLGTIMRDRAKQRRAQ